MDTEHHIPMVNSDFPVVNFDAVKDTYNKKLKSNDALFVDSRYRIFFIEFKNGTIDDIKNIELANEVVSHLKQENMLEYIHPYLGLVIPYNGTNYMKRYMIVSIFYPIFFVRKKHR